MSSPSVPNAVQALDGTSHVPSCGLRRAHALGATGVGVAVGVGALGGAEVAVRWAVDETATALRPAVANVAVGAAAATARGVASGVAVASGKGGISGVPAGLAEGAAVAIGTGSIVGAESAAGAAVAVEDGSGGTVCAAVEDGSGGTVCAAVEDGSGGTVCAAVALGAGRPVGAVAAGVACTGRASSARTGAAAASRAAQTIRSGCGARMATPNPIAAVKSSAPDRHGRAARCGDTASRERLENAGPSGTTSRTPRGRLSV
jgi:hypothetical protein